MKKDLLDSREARLGSWEQLLNLFIKMYKEELYNIENLTKIELKTLKGLVELAQKDGLKARFFDTEDLESSKLSAYPDIEKLNGIYEDIKAIKSKLVSEKKYEDSAIARDKKRKIKEVLVKAAFEEFYGREKFIIRKENELLFHPQYRWF